MSKRQKNEDEVVEAMAKAMALADGFDPNDKEVNSWDQFKPAARRQYLAHVEMELIRYKQATEQGDE